MTQRTESEIASRRELLIAAVSAAALATAAAVDKGPMRAPPAPRNAAGGSKLADGSDTGAFVLYL